ncbi:MAG TPA: hypothetical protein VMI93_11225 [Candidatus Solibacter sp.]|nr:hypothetical protein [Candidatus Solibacter sp.]
MSQSGKAVPFDPPATAAEASIRQLIANGKYKTALDQAKDNHKKQSTAASEALLLDAYAARIQSLLAQNLLREAQALMDLVCERFPAGRGRLESIGASVAARTNTLDDLLRPLNDPQLSPEHREAIEQAVRKEIFDLSALAACPVLPPEHPLRQAASSLDRAFRMVTTGAVDEEATRLPEVSRRSPLAPWKLLVRAIAAYYRGDLEACREQLDAIPADSAPARLVPAMRAMLGAQSSSPLSPAAKALVQQSGGDPAALRRALEALDRAWTGDSPRTVLSAARTAVQACRETAPGLLDRLKQHISVRCAVAGFDRGPVVQALGGATRHDAHFQRLLARAYEETGDLEDIPGACSAWEEFRQAAIKEGWFPPDGTEVATLYLHMASLACKIPPHLRDVLSGGMVPKKGSREAVYFLWPEALYQRACALDPHTEAFSEWLDRAREDSGQAPAERVAEQWHAACPTDLEPVLFLMEGAAARKAFPTALKYLAQAEQIDGVHPQVRRARLRLMAGGILRHIQQKKPHLAIAKLDALAALPEAHQGDRPAFLAALRFLIHVLRADMQEMDAAQAETERLLAGRVPAKLLIFGLAMAAKQLSPVVLDSPGMLTPPQRAAIPAALARVVALAKDMNSASIKIPQSYIDSAAQQLAGNSASLDTAQIQVLAEAGVNADHCNLAYTASAAGLQRGGASEARFLLLRARGLPERQFRRRALCAAAVVQIARQNRDTELLEKAANLLRGPLRSAELELTPAQAAEVLRKEKAEPEFLARSGEGPDYRDILKEKLCNCPECRRARGEAPDSFAGEVEDEFEDEPDLDKLFAGMPLPPDMPKDVAAMILEETRQAVERGESLESLMSRLFGPGASRRSEKKGRRR